jgi:hypothetical protein
LWGPRYKFVYRFRTCVDERERVGFGFTRYISRGKKSARIAGPSLQICEFSIAGPTYKKSKMAYGFRTCVDAWVGFGFTR